MGKNVKKKGPLVFLNTETRKKGRDDNNKNVGGRKKR